MTNPSPACAGALVDVAHPRDHIDERRALGIALGLRATAGARRIHDRWRSSVWGADQPSEDYQQRAFDSALFAILLDARWLVTGEAADGNERAYIGSRGELAAEQVLMLNVTRENLVWREATIEILSEEGERLNTPRSVMTEAVRMVRAGCDSAQMRLAAAFDARLRCFSEELEAERLTLRHHALHDQLTGLANRMLLEDRLEIATRTGKRQLQGFALLRIDLDGFKAINDTLGHDCGDTVLQRVAARLLASVRESDTVARLDGDEFTVILLGTNRAEVVTMCERIQASLGQRMEINGRPASVEASIGVALFPVDGTDPRSLLSAADAAMYRAKKRQVGRVEFAL